MKYINTNKLKQFNITKDNYYVVLDFDNTITSEKSLDSWMAVIDFEVYGETCKKEIEELNAYYAPFEFDYTLDYQVKKQYIAEWYQKSMDILYKYQLTYSGLQKAIEKGTLEFRAGAKEFLKILYQKKVPVIILSAGIGNTIEQFLKKNECYYDNIVLISNFIEFQDNKMQKYTAPILHSMNKRIDKHLPDTIRKTLQKKKYAILCGDMIEDIQMIKKEDLDRTITIGFLNRNIEENLKLYNQNYDIVLTKEEACFQQVEKIIKIRKEDV